MMRMQIFRTDQVVVAAGVVPVNTLPRVSWSSLTGTPVSEPTPVVSSAESPS